MILYLKMLLNTSESFKFLHGEKYVFQDTLKKIFKKEKKNYLTIQNFLYNIYRIIF